MKRSLGFVFVVLVFSAPGLLLAACGHGQARVGSRVWSWPTHSLLVTNNIKGVVVSNITIAGSEPLNVSLGTGDTAPIKIGHKRGGSIELTAKVYDARTYNAETRNYLGFARFRSRSGYSYGFGYGYHPQPPDAWVIDTFEPAAEPNEAGEHRYFNWR